MQSLFILGAGTMGLDIAQVLLAAGKDVIVCDVSDEIIAGAEKRLIKSLERRVEKGKMSADEKDAQRLRIALTTDMQRASAADLVIEAIKEDVAIKRAVFRELDAICKSECILATNTSSLSITEIASATNRPERCIGMHFFNPATVMKLVEIIRGAKTSDETFATTESLCREIGKEPVLVHEAPGFVVNRLLIPMINEACCIVESGVASIEAVDAAMKLGANHPMGPLALCDLIGLDVCLSIMDALYDETRDPKFRASLLLRKMTRAGQLGRKTGKGFYAYERGK